MPQKALTREMLELERVWIVGIDPGLRTTAMVLTKRDVPVAAVAVKGRNYATAPLECRVQDIAEYCVDYIESWMVRYQIENIFVQLETAIHNPGLVRNVKVLMSQCTLYGAIVSQLHRLADDTCRVFFAPVNNKTAKATFTGDGNANKVEMISTSAWRKRPDVEDREHLADAQAIAGVYGEIMEFVGGQRLDPTYVDSTLGKGPMWKNKWSKTGKFKGL